MLLSRYYWLAVVCAAFSLATLCDALDKWHPEAYPYHFQRAGGTSGQQYPWPLYPRAPHRPASQLYPRWPLPNRDPYSLRVRWPNGRPGTPQGSPRLQQTDTDQGDATPERPNASRTQVSNRSGVSRSEPAVEPKSGSVASSVLLSEQSQGLRRPTNQWTWPRKLFSSSSSLPGSSRTGVRVSCENGKVWRRGQCRCPYLSRWDSATSQCECIYGTYRHSSGHCHNY